MLEAPHLKAVAPVVRVAGIEVRRVEVQVPDRDVADRRSAGPAVPVVADVPCHALEALATEVAVARGGTAHKKKSIRSRYNYSDSETARRRILYN